VADGQTQIIGSVRDTYGERDSRCACLPAAFGRRR